MKNLLNRYAEFGSAIESIKENKDNEAEFLGAGAQSSVWCVGSGGADYAVKLVKPLSPRGRPRNVPLCVQNGIDTGLKGIGIAGLEQITAASPEDGAVVYELAPGVPVSSMKVIWAP